jgi:predicted Rossmann fold flavoprotein
LWFNVVEGPRFEVIVIGGGAAGLMCAIEAGKRGRSVLVLELAERVGKKILISGGGRCNFTNVHCKAENFISANPHFAKSALAGYTPRDFIALVEKHGIAYHEKTLGQLFCDGAAHQIVDMLLAECMAANVRVERKVQVDEIRRDTEFVLRAAETTYRAAALVIASGGVSIPKMGATGLGYEVARQFGIKIVETRPGLVPLVFNEQDRANLCDLAGISTEVIASIGRQRFRESLLITHRGVSGPAVLQISSYWHKPGAVTIDLAPGREVLALLLASPSGRDMGAAYAALCVALPQRLAERWLWLHPQERWTNAAIADMERQLHHWELTPEGTEGYDKAEVTAGGVDTDELHAKTMESRRVPGLFFIGEVVDVTGHLGGFNFQWAWASGAAAGRAV